MQNKVDFKKGTGTLIFGFMIMLLCLIVGLVLIQQYAIQMNAENTQMVTDALSDGSAIYASSLTGDLETRYNKTMEYTDQLVEYYKTEQNMNITQYGIDKDLFSENKINLNMRSEYNPLADYSSLPSFMQYEGEGGYTITRYAETTFNINNYGRDFIFPIDTNRCTSHFGTRDGDDIQGGGTLNHVGVDLKSVTRGQPFYAIAAGTVIATCTGYTHAIKIDHGIMPDGTRLISIYRHGDAVPSLHIGQTVTQGEQLGTTNGWGQTGPNHYGVHLHLEIEVTGTIFGTIYQNPLTTLYGLSFDGTADGAMATTIKKPNDTILTRLEFGEVNMSDATAEPAHLEYDYAKKNENTGETIYWK